MHRSIYGPGFASIFDESPYSNPDVLRRALEILDQPCKCGLRVRLWLWIPTGEYLCGHCCLTRAVQA